MPAFETGYCAVNCLHAGKLHVSKLLMQLVWEEAQLKAPAWHKNARVEQGD